MATVTYLESGTDATQDLAFFSSTVGTVSSATDQAHTGPRSLKMGTGNPAVAAQAKILSTIVSDTGTQISFWVRLSAVLPSAAAGFFSVRNSSEAAVFTLNLNTDGTLNSEPSGATAVKGTTALVANTWTRISVSYYITNSTTFAFKVYINGVLDTTVNAGTLSVTASDGIRFTLGALLGINVSGWWEDIYVATGGASSSSQPDPGNILVTAKRPSADGTSTQFTTAVGAAAGAHFDDVAEQPLNAANGWSLSNTTVQTEEYSIQNAATGDVNLTGLTLVDYMGWIYAKVDSTANSPVHHIIVGGVATAKTMTTSAAFYSKVVGSATYPAGNTDIGMDGAYTTTPHVTSLLECGIVIAYLPSAGGSQIKSVNGLAIASVKSWNGLAIASIKSINSLTNV
jgi:hypothetical protein